MADWLTVKEAADLLNYHQLSSNNTAPTVT